MPNWKKIKQLSFHEVSVRAAQKWSAFGERHSILPLGRLPTHREFLNLFVSDVRFKSSDELLVHFKTRGLRFFSSFENKTKTCELLRERFGNNPELLRRVNDVLQGRFDLLGLRGLEFGNPPAWNLEPIKGKRTPTIHWSKLDYLNAEVAGDKKIIWELNRHQYFMRLGRAYWLTGDEKYAEAFSSHLRSWLNDNVPKLGINWASSLEVSFRSISWLWAFHFFKDSASLSSELFVDALRYLYIHGRHLEKYLSTYFSPNTHLTGEALGLYYLGTVFPEFKDSERWRSTGRQILLDQLPIHVQKDGVYFEQTSYYHRYTTDFYLHFYLLSSISGDSLGDSVKNPLFGLLDHLMYLTRPDGTTPLFGDDDGGRLAMLDESASDDFRSSLSTGAVVFDRADYRFVAGGVREETLWLVGPSRTKASDSIVAREPEEASKAFRVGGYYVMRDGWSPTSNYLLFDCGPLGVANCGHAHADSLAFEMAVKGKTLLVDAGTYTYTGSRELRDWFRSSGAHNTLTIDNQSSSISSGPFSWSTKANCRTLNWISNDRFDYVSGTHDGYAPATHVRSILFLKHDYWIIRDEVDVESGAEIDVRFHFIHGSEPEISPSQRVIERKTGMLEMVVLGVKGEWKQEEGWVSHCYAQRDSARALAFSSRSSGKKTSIISLLFPAGTSTEVNELKADGGLVFEVFGKEWRDTLLVRTGKRVETGKLSSDFELTWIRSAANDFSRPLEVIGIEGTNVTVDNRSLLTLTSQGYGHVILKDR